MPQLRWNSLDILECLEVVPSVDDYETEFDYVVDRGPVRLELVVRPLESVLEITLRHEQNRVELIRCACFVRGDVRRSRAPERLFLTDVIIGPDRFWYQTAGDLFCKDRFPVGVGIGIHVQPDLRVEIVPNPH